MSPGPAPTLLTDWITIPGFFWLVAGCIAVVCLAILTVNIVHVWEEDDAANEDAQASPPPVVPRECNITGCHQVATNAFPTGIPNVPYYACTGHTPTVRQWAGPYDRTVEHVYDQELDQASDLGRWEQEMRS